MSDQETQGSTDSFGAVVVCGFSLLCIVASFAGGMTYQSHVDKNAVVVWDETVKVYNEMKTSVAYMTHPEAMSRRIEVENTEDGIGYIEIHFIPRAALPKPTDDSNNDEKGN